MQWYLVDWNYSFSYDLWVIITWMKEGMNSYYIYCGVYYKILMLHSFMSHTNLLAISWPYARVKKGEIKSGKTKKKNYQMQTAMYILHAVCILTKHQLDVHGPMPSPIDQTISSSGRKLTLKYQYGQGNQWPSLDSLHVGSTLFVTPCAFNFKSEADFRHPCNQL